MDIEWTDLSVQQIIAGNTAGFVFALGTVFVFLVLAAQYESWALPLAIILIVPMCLLAAITGVWLAGLDNNIFTQIGLVVLIGLAAKNAILIVEFAKQRQDAGAPAAEAVLEAAKSRLRPILMTSPGLHPGRRATRAWHRCRRRDATGPGHCGLLRDARRDRLRHLLHAGLILRRDVVHWTGGQRRSQAAVTPVRQPSSPRLTGARIPAAADSLDSPTE